MTESESPTAIQGFLKSLNWVNSSNRFRAFVAASSVGSLWRYAPLLDYAGRSSRFQHQRSTGASTGETLAAKNAALAFRTKPDVKEALRAAAEREHRSIANMMEVMIRDFCGRVGAQRSSWARREEGWRQSQTVFVIDCTKVVNSGDEMSNQAISQGGENGTVRATISFPAGHYAELERMAQEKKVSLAWVVRDAVEKYLADQWPLLGAQGRKEW